MKVELSRQSNCQYIQGKQDSLAAKAFLRSSCQGSQGSQGSQAVEAVKLLRQFRLPLNSGTPC